MLACKAEKRKLVTLWKVPQKCVDCPHRFEVRLCIQGITHKSPSGWDQADHRSVTELLIIPFICVMKPIDCPSHSTTTKEQPEKRRCAWKYWAICKKTVIRSKNKIIKWENWMRKWRESPRSKEKQKWKILYQRSKWQELLKSN